MSVEALRSSHREDRNVGVRLGEPSVVGGMILHVIDVDIRQEHAADEAMSSLRRMFPDAASFPSVISGSGGASRHFYFVTDKAFQSRKLDHSREQFVGEDGKNHWVWEIELFGTGKQVVLPPSIHPDTGKPYRWERPFDTELFDLGLEPFVTSEKIASLGVDVGTMGEDDDDDELLRLVRHPKLNLSVEDAREMLEGLPKDEWCDDRDGWLKVGMALHHEFDGSETGFKLWCEHSKQSEKFDLADQKRVWQSMRTAGKDPFTMASIRKVVRDDGGNFIQCKNKLEGVNRYRKALSVVADFELSPTEIDTILPTLKGLAEAEGRVAHAVSIKKDIAETKREKRSESDIRNNRNLEDWLAKETLRVFYGDGKHIHLYGDTFWTYQKGVWRQSDRKVVKNRVYRLISRVMGGKEGVNESLREMLAKSDRGETLNALTNSVIGVFEAIVATDVDPLRLCDWPKDSVINCTNGELWFENGEVEFRDHDPANHFTHQIASAYDPEAECPEWDRALKRIFRDTEDADDVIRHLHEVLGYVIQRTRNFATWVMFHGAGSNGKSFVASVLQAVLGPGASVGKNMSDFSNNNHAEAGLVGKLLMIDDDFKKGALLPDGMLKKLSEAKRITANPKNAKEFEFVNTAVPMILSNPWPKTSDLSHGLSRRAVVFEFNTTIKESEVDRGLFGRIVENELPGVLNRCIEGWMRLQARGRYVEPAACSKARALWLNKRNAVATFFAQCIEVTGDKRDRVLGSDLWDAYRRWSNEDNSGTGQGRNTFYDEIEALPGVTKTISRHMVRFTGLKLNFVPSAFDDEDGGDDDLI